MKKMQMLGSKVVLICAINASLLSGCGSAIPNAGKDNEAGAVENTAALENEIKTSEETENITEIEAPVSEEEALLNATWLIREDWGAAEGWNEHPAIDLKNPGIDSVQICDMFFYQGMSFEELYDQLTGSRAFTGDNTGFGIKLPEASERVWEVPDAEALKNSGEIDLRWEIYASTTDYNFKTMTIQVFLFAGDNETDGWIYNLNINLKDSHDMNIRYGYSGIFQKGIESDWALFHSCCRGTKEDVLVPYDMYKDFDAE